jgi:hypothetical protein
MRRGMGDRRQRPRFDIVGDLGGTLDASVLMVVRDVSRGGAQVESHVHLASGSLHRATFSCDGIETAAQVCVRHVTPFASSTGEQRYLIGAEFVSPTPALQELVERWLMLYGDSAFVPGEPS